MARDAYRGGLFTVSLKSYVDSSDFWDRDVLDCKLSERTNRPGALVYCMTYHENRIRRIVDYQTSPMQPDVVSESSLMHVAGRFGYRDTDTVKEEIEEAVEAGLIERVDGGYRLPSE